jgi:hypothetical protein
MHALPSLVGIAAAGLAMVGVGVRSLPLHAADLRQAAITAPALASQLQAARGDGSSFVRLRAEISQPSARTKSVLQVQIKSRRSAHRTDLVCQLIWPKERKGESILLTRIGAHAPSGTRFVPPDAMQTLDAQALTGSLFGTDLALEDLTEDFFSWKHQAFAGSEVVDGVTCRILESRPGADDWSGVASVRSWIDVRRTVPLRVEKYSPSGTLIRRIDTRKVVRKDGHWIAASFLVRQPGRDSQTEFESIRGEQDAVYDDSDFTPEGLRQLAPPRVRAK